MIDLSKIKLNLQTETNSNGQCGLNGIGVPQSGKNINEFLDKSFRCPHCHNTIDLPIKINFGGIMTFYTGNNKIGFEQKWMNAVAGTSQSKKKEPKKKVMESFSKISEDVDEL